MIWILPVGPEFVLKVCCHEVHIADAYISSITCFCVALHCVVVLVHIAALVLPGSGFACLECNIYDSFGITKHDTMGLTRIEPTTNCKQTDFYHATLSKEGEA